MTTLEHVDEGMDVDNATRVQVIARGLVEIFEDRSLLDLAQGVQNVAAAFEPSVAEVALLGYYARIAETEAHRFD